ncbi:MAG: T9SS type A sorting domain-containing protein [Bacteroidales bacterium]|nr:T9SS type A sorting domain-containing protein [Bacteroidales bacterium]
MKTNFRIWSLACVLCLLPSLLLAQEVLTGFYREGPTQTARNRQVQVQTLPFYDDFSSSLATPDSSKWLDRNAYVNSGFPLNPITHNTATLDALDAQGRVYEYAISNPFIAEHLTSTQIRLDSVFDPEPKALTPADSLYLSFFFQPQGSGLPPETNDSLVLEFGIPNDFDTTWYHIWSTPGQTLSQFLQENDSNYFKQVMIPITDLKYFTDQFFFRFYNYASIANNSQPSSRGNEDHWNIDVVYLNYNRTIDDTSYPKICFTGPTPSFLNRYRVMPYKHYRANPTSSITEEFEYEVSNLDNQPHTLKHQYTVEQVNGSQAYSYASNSPVVMGSQTYSQLSWAFVGQLFSLDYNRDSTSYLIRQYISDSTCNPPLVDSMVYHQGFYNYFAYDDGIPEMGYGVEPASSAFAVKFELSEMDTLRGVQILFNHTLNDANNKYFDIVVWKDNNGKPGEEVFRLPNKRPVWQESIFGFSYYPFSRLVKLNGTFYVGLVQRDNGLINIGLDMSNDNSQYNFFNSNGSWQQSSIHGSIMIRPVVGAGYFVELEEANIVDDVIVYPNPASTTLHIEGVSHGRNIVMYDMTGRQVLQTVFTSELSVQGLSNGMYLLTVTTDDGNIIRRKITVTP